MFIVVLLLHLLVPVSYTHLDAYKRQIAMDERPMEVMQKTLKVIRKADPDFKVSLAGNYHEERCV